MLTMHGVAPPHLHGMDREKFAIFEVLTAVLLLKVDVFWKMTLCCWTSGF
jgi:hypothetical protein